jgi:ribonuclease Y
MIAIIATAAAAGAATAGAAWLAQRRAAEQRLAAERAAGERRVETARESAAALAADAQRRAEAHAERLARALDDDAALLDADAERLERAEAAVERREASLDARAAAIDERYEELKTRRARLTEAREGTESLEDEFDREVERVAGERRDAVIERLADELTGHARIAAQKAARALEENAQAHAETEAKRLIDLACQRYGTALPANRLVTTVTLPSKADARQAVLADGEALLKALTEATDVDFERRDDDLLYLRAPDPFTREVGRLAYERTLRSSKPTVEFAQKMAEKAAQDLDKIAHDAGRRAARILKLKGVHQDILYLVGKLLYRTSYTQNQWQHAIETAHLCGIMAEDMGLDIRTAHRAALMHDIGKVLWAETEAVGSHAVSGAAFATAHGEAPEIVHPIAAHHGDEKPSTPLAHLVAAADALSGARPGARRETIESYSGRVEQVEAICADFRGIRQSYVIQGGREVRILVDPRQVDDLAAARMSEDVAHRIEDECIYPGQIKVTVIREIRSQAVAH